MASRRAEGGGGGAPVHSCSRREGSAREAGRAHPAQGLLLAEELRGGLRTCDAQSPSQNWGDGQKSPHRHATRFLLQTLFWPAANPAILEKPTRKPCRLRYGKKGSVNLKKCQPAKAWQGHFDISSSPRVQVGKRLFRIGHHRCVALPHDDFRNALGGLCAAPRASDCTRRPGGGLPVLRQCAQAGTFCSHPLRTFAAPRAPFLFFQCGSDWMGAVRKL